ncbi:ROK family protein, partial [Catenulispora pinisilvae]|uniref:ROK family protein n=1 Tax=Catenulispora pinisilvae TaxID=2705253 RepID=UPI0018925C40
LYLTVEVGLGGVLVIDGVPAVGGSGAGGEYGHMPFGDRSRRCPCGARGCWDNEVDGRALARHLGVAPPDDPRAFAVEVLERAERGGEADAAAAVRRVAEALASGVAGLVNAHDPDVVTLGGLAPLIRAAAQDDFDAAYLDGLMEFRRADPIPLRAASLGDDSALIGAAAAGLDVVLSEAGLDEWAADFERAAVRG